MGKLVRIVAWLVGLVVVIVVGLSIALPLLFDPNDYKEQIAELVQKETGRELTISGDIGFTVFPWLGLDLAGVELSNAQGFGDVAFARVASANVRVKLMPLLRKEIEMDTVTLDGLQLNLAKQKNGRTNWDDLVGQESEVAPDVSPSDGGLPITSFAIGGVQIRDAQVGWEDASTGERYKISKLNFSSGPLQPETAIDVELSLELESAAPKTNVGVEMAGSVWTSSSLQVFRVQQMHTKIDARGEELPGGRVNAELKTDVSLDLEKQLLDLAGLTLETLGLQLNGELHVRSISGKDPTFSGVLDIQQFVPMELLKAVGSEAPVTADATVLGKADAHFEFSGNSTSMNAKQVRLRFDDTEVKGSLGIRNFSAPAIQFDVAVDTLDLDRYLPPPSEDEMKAAATPATASAAATELLPVEMIRSLNLSGSVKIDTLKAFGIRSSNVQMKVNSKNGKLRLHPASANMYQGKYSGDITVDASGVRPTLSMKETVKQVQVGPLLMDMTGKEPITGMADITLQLRSVGNSMSSLQKSLNGTASFSFKDGAIKGVNIAKVIRDGKARLEGKSAPKDQQADQTDFSALTGTAIVTNGVVKNDDFTGQSPLLRLAGKGTVDLVKESIDYLLTVKLVGSLKGQGGEGLGVLKGVAIPVRVGGTFAKPTYRPDLEAALGGAVKAKVEEKIEKKKEEIKEKVEEKLKDKLDDQLKDQLKGGLKGLF